jgi:hypothetical protein
LRLLGLAAGLIAASAPALERGEPQAAARQSGRLRADEPAAGPAE